MFESSLDYPYLTFNGLFHNLDPDCENTVYDRFKIVSECVPDTQDVFLIASRLVLPLPQKLFQ